MVNEVSMNPNERRQTFDALIEQHLPLRPVKLRMLMELRESIAEARKKGASYEVIRSYLCKTAVNVSADTVARFCHQVLEEPQGKRSKGKRKARNPRANGTSATNLLKQKRPTSLPPTRYQAPSGPRIVDPKNL
jgi:IS30 family transposase